MMMGHDDVMEDEALTMALWGGIGDEDEVVPSRPRVAGAKRSWEGLAGEKEEEEGEDEGEEASEDEREGRADGA
jgi:hypothetical protein